MGEIDLLIKTITNSVMDCVSNIVKTLHYDKTYAGTVTEKSGNEYIVKIKGEEHKIKSKFDLNIGSSIYVLAIQNDMSNIIPLVTYNDIDKFM